MAHSKKRKPGNPRDGASARGALKRPAWDGEAAEADDPDPEPELPTEAADCIRLDERLTAVLGHYISEQPLWDVQDHPDSEDEERMLAGAPPPPSQPAADAVLRGLSVHTVAGHRVTQVRGLSLRFSDGAEVCTGLLRGTTEAVLELERGEHIVACQPNLQHHRPNAATSVQFVLSSGRKWCSKAGGGRCWGVTHTPDEPGSVLTRLGLSEHDLSIHGVK